MWTLKTTSSVSYTNVLLLLGLCRLGWAYARYLASHYNESEAKRLIAAMDEEDRDWDEMWDVGSERGLVETDVLTGRFARPASVDLIPRPFKHDLQRCDSGITAVGPVSGVASGEHVTPFETLAGQCEASVLEPPKASKGNKPEIARRRNFRDLHSKGERRFDQLAIALAGECYFKFGDRTRSEANNLISRKWMRDRIGDVKDLRRKDAAGIIDVALPLSFYPSRQALRMDQHMRTSTSARRMGSGPDSWSSFLLSTLGLVDYPSGTRGPAREDG